MSKTHNTKLNIRVSGEGCPVVFLHGFLESMTMWKDIAIESIMKVEVDLPGHGGSEILADSIANMAELVMETIHDHIASSYTVIGHSMGGYVALELHEMDSKCQHVVLLNSNMWSDSPEKQIDRERVAKIVYSKKEAFVYEAIPNLFHDPSQHDSEVRNLIKEAINMSAEAIAVSSLAMKDRRNFEDELFKTPDHFTIIQGANDPIVDENRMRHICEKGKLKYFVIDSGHMAHIEARTEVLKILEMEIKKNGN